MAVNKQVLNKRIATVARHAPLTRVPADVPSRQRQQLATAFRTLGQGVDPATAYRRTKQWFGRAVAEQADSLTTGRGHTGVAANDAAYDSQIAIRKIARMGTQVGQRTKLAAAFRTVAHGVDPEIAYQRTRQWYGSGGSGQDQTPA